MNPLLREAAARVSLGWLLAGMTVVFLGTFLFWTWWAYTGRHAARFEADSRLPLNDGGES
jgi:cbb3-type cytochrome oxidase subunit 3